MLGCPMMNAGAPKAGGEPWKRTALSAGPVSIRHPPGWSAKQDGRTLTMEAPGGQAWLSLRWGHRESGEQLAHLRRDVELFELGPSQLNPLCEAEVRQMILNAGVWKDATVSVTRRAFGMKRRSFALFASHAKGTLTLIVTTKWKAQSEPSIALARRLFSGIRVD